MTEACEALKISLRQEAEGYVLTVRIAEADMPEILVRSRINARLALAVAEIEANEELKPQVAVEAAKSKRQQNANVMRAAIVCNEDAFQTFLRKKYPKEWDSSIGESAGQAAETLRTLLKIDSRKDLAANAEALKGFDKLIAQYELWKRGQ